jgi:hypothetical protein
MVRTASRYKSAGVQERAFARDSDDEGGIMEWAALIS